MPRNSYRGGSKELVGDWEYDREEYDTQELGEEQPEADDAFMKELFESRKVDRTPWHRIEGSIHEINRNYRNGEHEKATARLESLHRQGIAERAKRYAQNMLEEEKIEPEVFDEISRIADRKSAK